MLFKFNLGELRCQLCPNTHITHTGNSDALSYSVNDGQLHLVHWVVLFFSKRTHWEFCCLRGYFTQHEAREKIRTSMKQRKMWFKCPGNWQGDSCTQLITAATDSCGPWTDRVTGTSPTDFTGFVPKWGSLYLQKTMIKITLSLIHHQH